GGTGGLPASVFGRAASVTRHPPPRRGRPPPASGTTRGHPGFPCPPPGRPSSFSLTPTRSRASSTPSWRSTRAWSTSSGTAGSRPGVPAAVLAGTGPVGQRVARLLARTGAAVSVGSRRLDRAQSVAESLERTTGAAFTPFATSEPDELARGLAGAAVVVAAGA